jgi:hypothetical protein
VIGFIDLIHLHSSGLSDDYSTITDVLILQFIPHTLGFPISTSCILAVGLSHSPTVTSNHWEVFFSILTGWWPLFSVPTELKSLSTPQKTLLASPLLLLGDVCWGSHMIATHPVHWSAGCRLGNGHPIVVTRLSRKCLSSRCPAMGIAVTIYTIWRNVTIMSN